MMKPSRGIGRLAGALSTFVRTASAPSVRLHLCVQLFKVTLRGRIKPRDAEPGEGGEA